MTTPAPRPAPVRRSPATARLAALAAMLAMLAAAPHASAQALRAEVAKPLAEASDLLKAGKAREALAKANQAAAVSGKTAAESLTVARMRAAAAQRAGDQRTAADALEDVFGAVGGAEQAQVAEALAFAHSQLKDYGKANQWIAKAQSLGSKSPQLAQLREYMQSQSGDYAAIAREAAQQVAAAEQAGRKPDEGDLLRLADAQQRNGQTAARVTTLEKLLTHHPKKEYWTVYLGQIQRKSGFSDRFSLDVMRLRLATGNLAKADEYMEMAQLALQAGLTAEANAIIDKGYKAGVLGTGAEAERHKRLRDLAVKRRDEAKASIDRRVAEASAQKDGNSLVAVGYEVADAGNAERGIALIEQGIAKGGLKRPDDAQLRLGMALLNAGPKHRARALQVLRSVKGADGASDLARLWTVNGPAA